MIQIITLSLLALGATGDRAEMITVLPPPGVVREPSAAAPAPVDRDTDLCRGWPVSLSAPGAGFPYTPTLYDADGDGADEIFVTGGYTFGLRGDGTFLPGWPTTEMENMGYGTNASKPGPSVANLDNDDDCEILWTLRDWWAGGSYMWCFNGKSFDGTDLPGFPQEAPDESSNALDVPFVLADVDQDGDLEAWGPHTVGNNFVHDRLSGFDHEGTRLFTVGLGRDENAFSLHFGDVDGDGEREMFLTAWFNPSLRLYVFEPDGSTTSGYPRILHTYSGGTLPFGPPIPADLDHDGDLEFVHGHWDSSGSRALCHHHDGTPFAGFPIEIATNSQLFYVGLGDVTGDGAPELLATDNDYGADHRIHVIDIPSGLPLPGWPLPVAHWPKSFPTVVDITNDGIQEVCFATGGGEVYAVYGTGDVVAGYPKQMMSPSVTSVGAGDIDGDGLFELVATTWDGWVYAWDTAGAALPGRADWPMRGIDARNTGIFGRTGTADVASGHPAPSILRIAVHPNPAPGTVAFRLPAGHPTRVEIFDPTGRRVGLVRGGPNGALTWQPRAAGLYYARPVGAVEGVRFVVIR